MSRRTGTVIANMAVGFVMVIFAIAAVLKFMDLEQFARDLATWEMLPREAVVPLAIVVATVEAIVAGAWMLGLRRRYMAWVGVSMLTAFTLAYLLHVRFATAPNCGCLGLVMRFEANQNQATLALVRNGLLLAIGFAGLGAQWYMSRARSTARVALDDGRLRPQPCGFTVIETILVVALIGVLLSLLLPSLGGVRREAKRLGSMSNLRSHVQVFAAYNLDYEGMFPYQTDPKATYTVFRYPFEEVSVEIPYFGAFSVWHWDLLHGYYNGEPRVFDSPNDPDGDKLFTDYWYSHSFIAHPEFWNAETRIGPTQWRPTTHADVLFPSSKAILYDTGNPSGAESIRSSQRRVEIAFVDGSARLVPWQSISRPYPRGDGNYPGSWFGFGIRLMHTIDGVRGRDVE